MKKSIRLFSFVMALILCIGIIPLTASAQTSSGEVVGSGYCGENVTWSLTDDGVLTISGEGRMYDARWEEGYYDYKTGKEYSILYVPWFNKWYNSYFNCSFIKRIVVNEGVTHIGNYVFARCIYLTDVVLPDGLESIGEKAFWRCRSIEEIKLPDSLTSIGDYAFQRCLALKSVTIPSGISRISRGLFHQCEALTDVVMPDSIKEIGFSSFAACASLESITIPDSVKKIENEVFFRCASLKSISVPDSVTEIGEEAFSGCEAMTEANLPYSLKTLSVGIFSRCKSLKTVRLANNKVGLSQIAKIERSAFYGCNKLKNIYYPGSEEAWSKIKISENNGRLSSVKLHKYYRYNDISGCVIKIPYPSYGYTGVEIKPKKLKVTTYSGTKLSEGKHYTISYENNVEYGTATVTVTGIGKYYGTATATFKIKPAKVKDLKLDNYNHRNFTATISWTKNPLAKKYYVYDHFKKKVLCVTEGTTVNVELADAERYNVLNIYVKAADERVDPNTGEKITYFGNIASCSVDVMP